MDEARLAAYRATDYRVRLARGGWATIHVDQPLPPELRDLAQDRPWGFITAWHPLSEPAPRANNRIAQHALLAALRTLPETLSLRPALGTSHDGAWKEASFWVVGPGVPQLDALARRFRQAAYVHGEGASPARLRLMPPV